MTKNHRQDYHVAWASLTPPLRPHPQVVAAVKAEIGGRPGRTLLLGVTPELADVATDLVAIDVNLSMVEHVWPGNTGSCRAFVGDWRKPHFKSGAFSVCVGDVSLSAIRFSDETAIVCDQLAQALRSGGKFICRVLASPDVPESTEAVRDAAISGAIHNFHAFKIRLGMALITRLTEPRVSADAIFRAFNSMFKNRDELVRITGWKREHIDTIRHYENSTVVFQFPTCDQLQSVVSRTFTNVRFVPTGTYELADRSPLLVADRD